MKGRVENPLVSVVIPVYNAERFLKETIESVLNQTYPNLECIVVNDGSTDGSGQIARSFGSDIRYIERSNSGVSAARNVGIDEAAGEYIAFLDSDDVWMPGKLDSQMPLFQNDVGLVYCGYYVGSDRENIRMTVIPAGEDDLLSSVLLLRGNAGAISSTGIVRKSAFEQVGSFDQRLSTAADADLVCRLIRRYKIALVEEPLVLYRQHGNQMHQNLRAMEHDNKLVQEKFFSSNFQNETPPISRAKAKATLESTLAIGYAAQRDFFKSAIHFVRALYSHPLACIASLSRLARIAPD